MSKLSNIIQRRELEPLFHKAVKICKHYEKAANCAASVIVPELDSCPNYFNILCKNCRNDCQAAAEKNACSMTHLQAINEARRLGSSYTYTCSGGFVFWTSPFYSGERFAGALLSGGVKGEEKETRNVESLARMMLICADQISCMSFIQKNITSCVTTPPKPAEAVCEDASTMEMERLMLASFRRGDNIEAKKILLDLIEIIKKQVNGDFEIFQMRAMELAVLFSRAVCNQKDIKEDSILETTTSFLKKIETGSDFQEITAILLNFSERMAEKIFSFQGVCHFAALKKAERYIWENYTRKISLREIADASGLSAPYFSTIFKEEMGENLSSYLNRLRVEKAAVMLLTTNLPISAIAGACGFEDQSWFSKIFKNNTGITPGKYREQGSFGLSA